MISKKGEDTINIPAYKANQVVDETGAGDVYFAIFLYEFLKSDKKWEEIKRAGYLASAAASFGIEKKGVDGFQSKKKVKERFQKKWGN
jgi:sugar/nucleoside kinase (ribokinase family)